MNSVKLTTEKILHQLPLGETSEWEFKEFHFRDNHPIQPKRDALADEVAAFANSRGGYLLCGVTDNGVAQGLTPEQARSIEKIFTELCFDSIKPPVHIHTEYFFVEGKLILGISIPKGSARHDTSRGTFSRVGSSKRILSSDEALRLAQNRAQSRFSWYDTQIVPNTGFQTLNESLWEALLSTTGAHNPEEGLERMALLAQDENGDLCATVAGILFCTHNPEQWLPNAIITATCYAGKDRASSQIDAQEITGPLNKQISDAVSFTVRNMHVAARKIPARLDLPQYSKKAIFEAVVNAVMHRDYTIYASRIRLSMFEDRLEIQSPGALPNTLTVENMASRQATRNQVLAAVLGRIPVGETLGSEGRMYFVERRGGGVPIIRRETYSLCGRLPEYKLIDNTDILLTIPGATNHLTPEKVVVRVFCGNEPLGNVDILAMFPNHTRVEASTDEMGEACLNLYTTQLPMTVFVATKGYYGGLETNWIPSQRTLAFNLASFSHGGSAIFSENTGTLPGLKGRLSFSQDEHERMYLHAPTLTVNEGMQQPARVVPGKKFLLKDSDGNRIEANLIFMQNRSSLIEWFQLTG